MPESVQFVTNCFVVECQRARPDLLQTIPHIVKIVNNTDAWYGGQGFGQGLFANIAVKFEMLPNASTSADGVPPKVLRHDDKVTHETFDLDNVTLPAASLSLSSKVHSRNKFYLSYGGYGNVIAVLDIDYQQKNPNAWNDAIKVTFITKSDEQPTINFVDFLNKEFLPSLRTKSVPVF